MYYLPIKKSNFVFTSVLKSKITGVSDNCFFSICQKNTYWLELLTSLTVLSFIDTADETNLGDQQHCEGLDLSNY